MGSEHVEQSRATKALRRAARGEQAAVDDLLPLVYEELRALAGRFMARERKDHTLQTTALVHEAYVRLIDQRNIDPADRDHFFAIAATTIRRVLVDHAKQRNTAKRGGGAAERVTIAEADLDAPDRDPIDLLALDDALRKLAELDERAAKVVTMRYFAGLTVEQIAAALKISPRTVADDWATARAWLRRELTETDEPADAKRDDS